MRTLTKRPKKPIADVISSQEIYELGLGILDPQLRILYFILYLTGARIEEVLRLRVRDITHETVEDEPVVTFKVFTEKNRLHPVRNLPAFKDHKKFPIDKLMLEQVDDYTKDMLIDESLFTYSRTNAWNRFKRNKLITTVTAVHGNKIIENYDFSIHPQYLRHCRLTHLKEKCGFDSLTLMVYAGWSDPRPSGRYLHVGKRSLVKAMKR